MRARESQYVDEQLLEPIPEAQFQIIIKKSGLGHKTRAAVRSVLVPPCDENGFPLRDENGLKTLSISDAALKHGLQPANLSRAIGIVQKRWNEYLSSTKQHSAYGAVSSGFFQAMRTVQEENAEKQTSSKAARKSEKTKPKL